MELLAFSPTPLIIVTLFSGVFSLWMLIRFIAALLKARVAKASVSMVLCLVGLPVALLCSSLLVGIQSYQALTKETEIALLNIRPLTSQRFAATLILPGGETEQFLLRGDEVQIDARIIKWQPIANIFGLHTHYQLDRITGRYRTISDSRSKQPSVYPLRKSESIDLFTWRQRYAALDWLMDVEYGSSSFISADKTTDLKLMLSTTGLLFRPVNLVDRSERPDGAVSP